MKSTRTELIDKLLFLQQQQQFDHDGFSIFEADCSTEPGEGTGGGR